MQRLTLSSDTILMKPGTSKHMESYQKLVSWVAVVSLLLVGSYLSGRGHLLIISGNRESGQV